MNKKEALRDICPFCKEFHGEDRSESCTSVCSCAQYANQDWVYQREWTIGLPMGEGKFKEVSNSAHLPACFDTLNPKDEGKFADFIVKASTDLDERLFLILLDLIHGATRKELCESYGITEDTYDDYIDRIQRFIEGNL